MAKAQKTEKEPVFAPVMLTDPAEREAAALAMANRKARALVTMADNRAVNDPRRAHAREVIADAACRVGDEAITAIVLPTIERVMNGDILIVDLHASVDSGLVKAVRSKGLHHRLSRLHLSDELIAVALRFNKAFERAARGFGKLTAGYDGGSSGGTHDRQQDLWVQHMQELAAASHGPVSYPLTHDERVVLYGYVLHDVSMADAGRYVASAVSPDKKMHMFTGKLLLHKALEKLAFFYEEYDYRHSEAN